MSRGCDSAGPPAGAGQKSREEGAAGTMCDELREPPLPCGTGGAEGRGFRGEVEPGKKGGLEQGGFSFGLFLTVLICS